MTCLETLYVQVDNTSANKCFTVIVGLAALVALGVYNKVVLAFLLVGHTHTDVDRIIDSGVKNSDAGVFKVESVVVEHYKSGAEVVVYRCKYNEKTRTWNPGNMKDPIRVADEVQYTKN